MTSDLTVEQVAQLTHTTEETVRRLCRTRRLPAYKLGQQWRVPRWAFNELRHVVELGGEEACYV